MDDLHAVAGVDVEVVLVASREHMLDQEVVSVVSFDAVALDRVAAEVERDAACAELQSVAGAVDVRGELGVLRDRLAAGEDDKQVIQFIVTRYGDWVLLNPPFKASTLLLWLGPAVLLVIASITVIIYFRRRGIKNTEVPLTAEEKRRLNTLLEDES